MFERIKEFLKEVRGEIKKITFPTREETISSSVVVVAVVVVVSVFLSLVDFGLTKIIKSVIK
ncbi:MAG: preprotein translocase subunit SecE [Nitrospirae bacterium RBG_19FT_COMBO_42_15]|nr:MAG: preprotein translocase subunit SecE [Nitrospirae bacterium RBG_19FT_COMBO_42_15]